MKNKILFIALLFSVFSGNAQPILKIYINHVYWNGEKKISISPRDTIEFKLEHTNNSKYQFQKIAFEVVLRGKFLFFTKENNRRIQLNPQTQYERVKMGLKLDSPGHFVIDPEKIYGFSDNPSFIIPCQRFLNYVPLSRIIVHVYGVNKLTGNNTEVVDLRSLAYSKSLFRDGFSFWRGVGFN